jgi:hypothetical protein
MGQSINASPVDREASVSVRKRHEIWIEQCDAAQNIKLRYGLIAAFDYVVGEKLLNFASAAYRHAEFARELPGFVTRVRCLFTPQEMRVQIARIEQQRLEEDACSEEDDDDFLRETPAAAAERARQFATIKELLTAAELGTS